MEGTRRASYHRRMLMRVVFWVAMAVSAICAIGAVTYLAVGSADLLTALVFGFIPAMVVNWFGWSARYVHHSDAVIAPRRPTRTAMRINEPPSPDHGDGACSARIGVSMAAKIEASSFFGEFTRFDIDHIAISPEGWAHKRSAGSGS